MILFQVTIGVQHVILIREFEETGLGLSEFADLLIWNGAKYEL